MKQVALISFFALTASWLGTAQATPTVRIYPTLPTTSDSVSVEIQGGGANTCSSLGEFDCTTVTDTLIADATINYCSTGNGFDTAWSYDKVCSFGRLAAGDYVVAVREERDPHDSQRSSTQYFPLVVTGPTPVTLVTLGRLRAYYR